MHPDKMTSGAKQLPNGNVQMELSNPADYLVGRVIQMHVAEIVKGDVNKKTYSMISIFVPGATPTEGSPVFEDKQKYLVSYLP